MARPPDTPEDLGGLYQCPHCMRLKRPDEFYIITTKSGKKRRNNACIECANVPKPSPAPRFTQASLAAWAGFVQPGDSDRMTP
jgi:hypothetical protein